MQKSALIAMMHRQNPIGSEGLEAIEKLCTDHPWCPTFQLLKAIGLRDTDDINFKAQLNLAAAYAADRSLLYDYVIRKQVEQSISTIGDEGSAETSTSADVGSMPTSPQPIAAPAEDEVQETEGAILSISSEPLEEQIMREAVMQIGELEGKRSLEHAQAMERDEPIDEGASGFPTSFGAWLLKVDGRNAEARTKKAPESALIEKFIQESPQISPVKKAFFSPSQMGKLSLVEDESFVSETLAKIYERQGDYKKAIRAYTNLGLKYPEKSTYFAALQKQAEAHLKNS